MEVFTSTGCSQWEVLLYVWWFLIIKELLICWCWLAWVSSWYLRCVRGLFVHVLLSIGSREKQASWLCSAHTRVAWQALFRVGKNSPEQYPLIAALIKQLPFELLRNLLQSLCFCYGSFSLLKPFKDSWGWNHMPPFSSFKTANSFSSRIRLQYQ